MNTKRSWVHAALLLAVVALAADQAVGSGKEGGVHYKYTPYDVFSTEKLNEMLGYSLERKFFGPTQNPEPFSKNTRTLINLLAWTKDKDKKEAILGMFSVNQLLEWNRYHPDKCTPNDILEHREQCAKVDPAKIGFPEDQEIREAIKSHTYRILYDFEEPLEYLKYSNLHSYCMDSLKFKDKECLNHQIAEADATVKFDTEVVKGFVGAVNRDITANEIEGRYDLNKVVKRVLKEMEEKEQAKAEAVKTNCAILDKALGSLVDASRYWHRDSKYGDYLKTNDSICAHSLVQQVQKKLNATSEICLKVTKFAHTVKEQVSIWLGTAQNYLSQRFKFAFNKQMLVNDQLNQQQQHIATMQPLEIGLIVIASTLFVMFIIYLLLLPSRLSRKRKHKMRRQLQSHEKAILQQQQQQFDDQTAGFMGPPPAVVSGHEEQLKRANGVLAQDCDDRQQQNSMAPSFGYQAVTHQANVHQHHHSPQQQHLYQQDGGGGGTMRRVNQECPVHSSPTSKAFNGRQQQEFDDEEEASAMVSSRQQEGLANGNDHELRRQSVHVCQPTTTTNMHSDIYGSNNHNHHHHHHHHQQQHRHNPQQQANRFRQHHQSAYQLSNEHGDEEEDHQHHLHHHHNHSANHRSIHRESRQTRRWQAAVENDHRHRKWAGLKPTN